MARFKLDTTVSILGTVWAVRICTESEEPRLTACDGFTDKTSHVIKISDMSGDCDLDVPAEYVKKLIRHEVVHAFLFESGLAENWEHKGLGHEELTVDWIAIQFPKIQSVIKQIYDKLEEVRK